MLPLNFPGRLIRRFLVAKAARNPEPIRFHVVLNWTEELKRLVPTK
jgi:hypothetical protein